MVRAGASWPSSFPEGTLYLSLSPLGAHRDGRMTRHGGNILVETWKESIENGMWKIQSSLLTNMKSYPYQS